MLANKYLATWSSFLCPRWSFYIMSSQAKLILPSHLNELGAPEPSFYLDDSQWGFFTIIAMDPKKSRWNQGERISFSYPLHELHERLAEWSHRGRIEQKSIFVSQCMFSQPCRRRSAFKSVGQIFVDLDSYNAPSLHVRCMTKPQLINQVYQMCEANDLPVPSIILSSGRGLYLKWFTNEVATAGLAIWEHAQQHLNRIFEPLGADNNAKDVSRILRLENTYNQKNNQMAEVIDINWDGGEPAKYSFNKLCKTLLPYTIDEVRDFNAKREETTQAFNKKRRQITREINQRRLVLACLYELKDAGLDSTLTPDSLHKYVVDTRGSGKVSLSRCTDLLKRWEKIRLRQASFGTVSDTRSLFAKKNLAWTRYGDILRIAKQRYADGHIEDGLRSPFFLYACNFYALSEWRNINIDFYHEFNSIGNSLVPHWSNAKKGQASSDVYKRLKETKRGVVREHAGREFLPLLTPKNSTLIDLLKITNDEMQEKDASGNFIIKTIISHEEKQRRRPIHDERRRRERGIVSRDSYNKERDNKLSKQITEAKRLKEKGMNGKDIAIAMNVTAAWVSKLLKK